MTPWNKGKHTGNYGNGFQTGNIPWNKDKEYLAVRGEKNPFWKGDDVSYHTLHHWIQRWLGKVKECVYCGNENNIQWASISHKAKRDLSDYIPLCAKCHSGYDNMKGGGFINGGI